MRDIPEHVVKKGDFDGWVENENNLSQTGNCWIANDGIAFKGGYVLGNALVKDLGIVRDRAIVTDNALVCDTATITKGAALGGYSKAIDFDYIKGEL